MRARSLLFVVALAAAGCVPRGRPTVIQAESIPHRASPAAATRAATEGLEDAGLDVDAHGPSLSTSWRSTAPVGTRLAPTRRLAIRVRVDPGSILVRPIAEECDEGGCMPVAALLPEEALLVTRAVDAIRSRLDVLDDGATAAVVVPREPEPPVVIERQATRDPVATPTGRGPIAIPTRMGPTEVAAGWHIDAVLVNGALVSGRVVGVSADGLVIELGPGRDLTLWAGDLASIRVR